MTALATILITAGLLPVAAPALAEEPGAARTRITERLVDPPGHLPPGPGPLAADLTALGTGALPDLFTILHGHAVPAAWAVGRSNPFPLEQWQLDGVVQTFQRLPKAEVRAFLLTLARPGVSAPERASALRLCSLLGDEGDLRLTLRLAHPATGDEPLEREVREALELALTNILERHPTGVRFLRGTFDDLDLPVAVAVVRAMGRSPSTNAFAILGGLIGKRGELDQLILSELRRRVPLEEPPYDEYVLTKLRERLHADRRQTLIETIILVGDLEDDESVDKLLAFLGHSDANIRKATLRALQSITRVRYGADPRAWKHWYSGELTWWDDQAPSLLADLRFGDGAQACSAINSLARRRLFRRELSHALVTCLDRPEEEVRRLAIAALDGLASGAVIPLLIDRLGLPDEDRRTAAWTALRVITGRDLPPDQAAWRTPQG